MPGTRAGPAGGPENGDFRGGGAAVPHTAPTVADVVERVVGRFDGDGDDLITLAEVLALLDPEGTRTTLAERATAAVAAADTDGNSTLTSAELTAAVAALDTDADGTLDRDDRISGSTTDAPDVAVLLHAHGPRGGHGHGQPQPVATIVERVFVRIDGDDSGTISLAELVAHLGRRGDADADARAAELLLALDSNQDQSIGSDELASAVAALDSDGSGSISAAEHQAAVDADLALVGVLHGC